MKTEILKIIKESKEKFADKQKEYDMSRDVDLFEVVNEIEKRVNNEL